MVNIICSKKACKSPAEAYLQKSADNKIITESFCMQHFYEQYYKRYRRCVVEACDNSIYKQFLYPPARDNGHAYGPYVCQKHFKELKSECIIDGCKVRATTHSYAHIKSQKIKFYLCQNHADYLSGMKKF